MAIASEYTHICGSVYKKTYSGKSAKEIYFDNTSLKRKNINLGENKGD